MPLGGHSFFEDVPLVEFMYLVFLMPSGVTIDDTGLCCYIPCLLSTIISLCLVILHRHSRPHSVSDYSIERQTDSRAHHCILTLFLYCNNNTHCSTSDRPWASKHKQHFMRVSCSLS